MMAIITEQRVAPLSMGDQLTREEFLRRWEAEPSIKLAELIKGTVYMPSLVSVEHGGTNSHVALGWASITPSRRARRVSATPHRSCSTTFRSRI
jgi:hypothetical protein